MKLRTGSQSVADPACPDHPLTAFEWTVIDQPNGSNLSISGAQSMQASVDLLIPGNYTFKLEVIDTSGSRDHDPVYVTLEETTCGPVEVDAGPDLDQAAGEAVTLQGSFALHPESESVCQIESVTVFIRWEQVSGPEVPLAESGKLSATFVPPELGEYTFRAQAVYPVTQRNRHTQESLWDTMTVSVSDVLCHPPTADAGRDQIVGVLTGGARPVTLDGTRSCLDSRCPEADLIRYSWTLLSAPAGASTAFAGDGPQVTAQLEVPGLYQFRLEVQDDAGTDRGRTDTDTDVVVIEVRDIIGCDDTLRVTVLDADSRLTIENTRVDVLDAADVSHQGFTDADGIVDFQDVGLLQQKSITVISDQLVPALPGTGDDDRPRYEVTSVLDHCGNAITIPLRLTASGQAAIPKAALTAKIPQNIFDLLPHSYKCTRDCTEDTGCPIPYGVALAAFDLEPGHALLPQGGRVFAGFGFNHRRGRFGGDGRFLVPEGVLLGHRAAYSEDSYAAVSQ